MSGSTDRMTTPITAWEANRRRGGGSERSVLLPLVEGEVSEHALKAAQRIAVGSNAGLVVLNTVTVPEQTPLTLPDHLREQHWQDTTRVVEAAGEGHPSLSITGSVHVGHRLRHVIADAMETYAVETAIFDDSWNESRLSPLTRTPLEKVLAEADCPAAIPTGRPVPETVSSILVPVAGGPHSGLATKIAGAIANTHDAWVELLHVVSADDPAQRERAEQFISASSSHLTGHENMDTWILEADDVADAIIEQTQYYGLTVIGAPRTPRLRRVLFGSTARTVQKNAPRSLLTVWSSTDSRSSERVAGNTTGRVK